MSKARLSPCSSPLWEMLVLTLCVLARSSTPATSADAPKLTPWAEACQERTEQPQARTAAADGNKATHGAEADVRTWNLGGAELPRAVARLLQSHGVFCDGVVARCNVSLSGDLLRICLPAAALRTRLCEPWGEKWQQRGGLIAVAMDADGCTTFSELPTTRPRPHVEATAHE